MSLWQYHGQEKRRKIFAFHVHVQRKLGVLQVSLLGSCGPNVSCFSSVYSLAFSTECCLCVAHGPLGKHDVSISLLIFSWHSTAMISSQPMVLQKDKEVCFMQFHLS